MTETGPEARCLLSIPVSPLGTHYGNELKNAELDQKKERKTGFLRYRLACVSNPHHPAKTIGRFTGLNRDELVSSCFGDGARRF